jgi:RNase P/RNase MRP subunit POP5
LVKRWRKRYIVFKCKDWRKAMVSLKGARLIYSDGEYGIIRIKHLEKDRALGLLNQVGETVKTTGSIKKAKEILSICRGPR